MAERATEGASRQPLLSDEAAAHVGELILHRPEMDDLTIVLHPARCAWCREIAEAWLGTNGRDEPFSKEENA